MKRLSDAQLDELARARDGFKARNSKRYVTRRYLERCGLLTWADDGLKMVLTDAGRAALEPPGNPPVKTP